MLAHAMSLGLVLLLLGLAVAAISDPAREAFTQFQLAFGKQYADGDEYDLRLTLFRRNLDRIRQHNYDYQLGRHRFYLALNQFADRSDSEFAALGGYRPTANPPTIAATALHTSERPEPSSPLPDAVDWRHVGMVTRVKNQQQCGSCWSFSATGAMEGAHARASGELVEFSEQQLVDCVDGGADDCETGGEMRHAFVYVIGTGAETEHAYPYRATSGHHCKDGDFRKTARFTSYVNITEGDERALQAALAKHAAVSVAIDAASFEFQMYGGGIFDSDECRSDSADLNHGVLAVGYGTDPDDGDYWIVKNSWGAFWGEGGYVRMARNKDNQCGIATDASYILVGREIDDQQPVQYQ